MLPLQSKSPAAPERFRVLQAQLRCYLCAETCGVLEAPPDRALPPLARFSAADGAPARLVAWRALRCPRCGSASLYVDEPETLQRRVERIDWELDRPRRGRPPRWLVAQRSGRGAA